MKAIITFKKVILIMGLMVVLSGFSWFGENVPPPKDLRKSTAAKNAGIVIPSFDASPYAILENSYDPLNALMFNPEEGIFVGLSTSNFDFSPHKLSFRHKKFGFVAHNVYRVRIGFFDYKKPQKLSNFSFAPFEISEPKTADEVKAIADTWVKFFDSLGWKRGEKDLNYPYGPLPKRGSWPYMEWNTDIFELSVNIARNESPSNISKEPRYYITIVFANIQPRIN